MPTRPPEPARSPEPRSRSGPGGSPTPAFPASPALPLPALASAWLAGLVLLAAVAGAADRRPACAAAAVAGTTPDRAHLGAPADGPGADLEDMRAHDRGLGRPVPSPAGRV